MAYLLYMHTRLNCIAISMIFCKKSLKIPIRNTMIKGKSIKGQTTINKTYCSSSCTRRRVNLVTNPVISHECGKDREVPATSGTYPWSFVTQIFHNGHPWHYDFNLTKWNPWFSSFLVSRNPLTRKS